MNTETFNFNFAGHSCFVINDDALDWKVEDLIGASTTQDQLKQVALDYGLDLDQIPTSTNCLLLCKGTRNVLVDAGSGKRPYAGGDEGQLMSNLESLDFMPSDINEIIITHSDYDHIGGLLNKNGDPEFPNANYYLSRQAWEYWSSIEGRTRIAALHDWPEDRIEYVWKTYSALQDSLNIVDYGDEFLPGMRMQPAAGHRYDHDVVIIEGSNNKLIHLADSLLHPLMMANRAWYYSYDIAPEKAIETKERLLKWSASEKALVFATHFPFPGLGTVQRLDRKWRWEPFAE